MGTKTYAGAFPTAGRTMTSHPTLHFLPLRQETLLSLDEGDELRCIGGRLQVRTAGTASLPRSLALEAQALQPHQSWRMPCAGIAVVDALEPGTCFVVQRHTPEPAQTQENRADPWARRLWLGGMSALRLLGGSVR